MSGIPRIPAAKSVPSTRQRESAENAWPPTFPTAISVTLTILRNGWLTRKLHRSWNGSLRSAWREKGRARSPLCLKRKWCW